MQTATIRPFRLGGSLAERLRELREQHLTQKQLARVLGGAEALSIATVSPVGKGRLRSAAFAATASRVRPAVLHEQVARLRDTAFAPRR